MAVTNYFQLQAFEAGEDLSKSYACFVSINNTGQIKKCAAADIPVGVVINPAPKNQTVGVCCELGVKVPAVASAAITAGSKVGLAADGKIVAATTGSAIGVALEAAKAANDVITILFIGKTAIA